ncbi:MAG: FadR/GntR family transcriptional regulator [Dehalococcoidales bacterium]|nr:FadR/GntR family transcriptional regulator [Dehalococcoidales bacterium]
MFTPIKQTRVVEEVASQITDRIMDGTLKTGERIPSERELAAQFHVSRATIREALRMLEQSGLVVVRLGPLGGGFVAEASAEPVVNALSLMLRSERTKLAELMEARQSIEATTARLAAERAGHNDLAAMLSAIELMEANCSSKQSFLETNAVFHEALAEAARNSVLLMTLRAIRGLIYRSIDLLPIDQEMSHSSARFHREIYEAVVGKNPDAAELAMRCHLDSFEKRLEKRLQIVLRNAPDPEA